MDVTKIPGMYILQAKAIACKVESTLKVQGSGRIFFLAVLLAILSAFGACIYAAYLAIVKKVELRRIPDGIAAVLSKYLPTKVIFAGLLLAIGVAFYVTAIVVGILRTPQSG